MGAGGALYAAFTSCGPTLLISREGGFASGTSLAGTSKRDTPGECGTALICVSPAEGGSITVEGGVKGGIVTVDACPGCITVDTELGGCVTAVGA
jgi:hypothetical protein